MQKYKKCAKSFMTLDVYYGHTKFIALLHPQISYIARKFNLLLHIPYKGTYL